jgi:hypothetical protein
MHLGEAVRRAQFQEGEEYTREILVEVGEEHRVGALHDG